MFIQIKIYLIGFNKNLYFRFIGEESVAAGQKYRLTDDPTWIIDPIDGTTNFVHRFLIFFVCIKHTCFLYLY